MNLFQKVGLIKFKADASSEEESFVETSIAAMDFYDEDEARRRSFAMFNLNEEQTGKKYALLFEVLMEFEKFALLTRVERVDFAVRMRHDPNLQRTYAVNVGLEQFENLCLVNDEGSAAVVLRVSQFARKKIVDGKQDADRPSERTT